MSISVLVVEKDPLMRETLVCMLEAMKCTAVPVESTRMAYEVLGAVIFDVLVVGVSRSDPDGVGIAMDAKGYQRNIKLVVVSGHYRPECLRSRVDSYLQKPFTLGQIDGAVQDVLYADEASLPETMPAAMPHIRSAGPGGAPGTGAAGRYRTPPLLR
jgi:DNA-binding NtrC family response regulator